MQDLVKITQGYLEQWHAIWSYRAGDHWFRPSGQSSVQRSSTSPRMKMLIRRKEWCRIPRHVRRREGYHPWTATRQQAFEDRHIHPVISAGSEELSSLIFRLMPVATWPDWPQTRLEQAQRWWCLTNSNRPGRSCHVRLSLRRRYRPPCNWHVLQSSRQTLELLHQHVANCWASSDRYAAALAARLDRDTLQPSMTAWLFRSRGNCNWNQIIVMTAEANQKVLRSSTWRRDLAFSSCGGWPIKSESPNSI